MYSGFSTICKISKKNIRHYQEIIKNCIIEHPGHELEEICFNQKVQSAAVTKVSNELFDEIVRFGSTGEQLLSFVKRLCFIFELSHKRLSQSEIEINHFSLAESDISKLTDRADIVISEGKRWSVLFEENNATKNKTDTDISTNDYVLNPIYAAKYGISPNKNRKITFKARDIETCLLYTSPSPRDRG